MTEKALKIFILRRAWPSRPYGVCLQAYNFGSGSTKFRVYRWLQVGGSSDRICKIFELSKKIKIKSNLTKFLKKWYYLFIILKTFKVVWWATVRWGHRHRGMHVATAGEENTLAEWLGFSKLPPFPKLPLCLLTHESETVSVVSSS